MDENILRIKNVTMVFPGITALKDVSFDIKRHAVHCIVGENGAGKSTLIKILAGAQKQTRGDVFLNGEKFTPHSTKQAMENGVSVLFQELNVIEHLTVEENLTLGMEKNWFGVIRKPDNLQHLEDILHSIDPNISMKQKVAFLSVGERQILQIAKALAANAQVLIMDEPTAALSEEETRRLFQVVDTLKQKKITIIYISHKLEEIFQIGEYVTVLLDGQVVGTEKLDELDPEKLVHMMLGKIVVEKYHKNEIDFAQKSLCARNLRNHLLKEVSFDLHKGEILGFYGLLGSGKTEIARALMGIDPFEGSVELSGRPACFKNPVQAYKNGLCIVPEERRTQGIVGIHSIRENITLTNPGKITAYGVRSERKEREIADQYIDMLGIAARDAEQRTESLSGGNQQKVVFGKCLNSNFSIMLLDEPTRGVDVGAKEEIHDVVRKLARDGHSIIVFTSELPEVLNLCDRIAVLYEGRLVEEFANGNDVDPKKIMHLALGGEINEC